MKSALFYLLSFLISCTIYLQAQRKDNWQRSFIDTPIHGCNVIPKLRPEFEGVLRFKKIEPVFRPHIYSPDWRVPYPVDNLEEKQIPDSIIVTKPIMHVKLSTKTISPSQILY